MFTGKQPFAGMAPMAAILEVMNGKRPSRPLLLSDSAYEGYPIPVCAPQNARAHA
jgi:hypothetical protein